jgi:hypothetical protein
LLIRNLKAFEEVCLYTLAWVLGSHTYCTAAPHFKVIIGTVLSMQGISRVRGPTSGLGAVLILFVELSAQQRPKWLWIKDMYKFRRRQVTGVAGRHGHSWKRYVPIACIYLFFFDVSLASFVLASCIWMFGAEIREASVALPPMHSTCTIISSCNTLIPSEVSMWARAGRSFIRPLGLPLCRDQGQQQNQSS